MNLVLNRHGIAQECHKPQVSCMYLGQEWAALLLGKSRFLLMCKDQPPEWRPLQSEQRKKKLNNYNSFRHFEKTKAYIELDLLRLHINWNLSFQNKELASIDWNRTCVSSSDLHKYFHWLKFYFSLFLAKFTVNSAVTSDLLWQNWVEWNLLT